MTARTIVIQVRMRKAELEDLDSVRGERTRSEYIRWLIDREIGGVRDDDPIGGKELEVPAKSAGRLGDGGVGDVGDMSQVEKLVEKGEVTKGWSGPYFKGDAAKVYAKRRGGV